VSEHKLSPEDMDLAPFVRVKPRSNHKRQGTQMMEAVHISGQMIHRIVMERILGRPLKRIEHVDHINTDPIDNRRENLRVANAMQNQANRYGGFGMVEYKGVYYDKSKRGSKKWKAQMSLAKVKGKYVRLHLGWFNTAEEAALEYNKIAKEWYGEFARLNIIK
jgi:hypothetical protein